MGFTPARLGWSELPHVGRGIWLRKGPAWLFFTAGISFPGYFNSQYLGQ